MFKEKYPFHVKEEKIKKNKIIILSQFNKKPDGMEKVLLLNSMFLFCVYPKKTSAHISE